MIIKLEKPPAKNEIRGYKPQVFVDDPFAPIEVTEFNIKVNENIEKLHSNKYWEFPYDKFVEYGPEDEWWARKYGFGKEVDKSLPAAYSYESEIQCNKVFYDKIMGLIGK